jgi:hypothetical protein
MGEVKSGGLFEVIMCFCLFVFDSALPQLTDGAVGEGGGRTPTYLWPLGNTTVYHEVLHEHDAHLPEASQCFVFGPGYPGKSTGASSKFR